MTILKGFFNLLTPLEKVEWKSPVKIDRPDFYEGLLKAMLSSHKAKKVLEENLKKLNQIKDD